MSADEALPEPLPEPDEPPVLPVALAEVAFTTEERVTRVLFDRSRVWDSPSRRLWVDMVQVTFMRTVRSVTEGVFDGPLPWQIKTVMVSGAHWDTESYGYHVIGEDRGDDEAYPPEHARNARPGRWLTERTRLSGEKGWASVEAEWLRVLMARLRPVED